MQIKIHEKNLNSSPKILLDILGPLPWPKNITAVRGKRCTFSRARATVAHFQMVPDILKEVASGKVKLRNLTMKRAIFYSCHPPSVAMQVSSRIIWIWWVCCFFWHPIFRSFYPRGFSLVNVHNERRILASCQSWDLHTPKVCQIHENNPISSGGLLESERLLCSKEIT